MKEKIFNVLDNVAILIICITIIVVLAIILISTWKTGIINGLISTLVIPSIIWIVIRSKTER